uniref:type VI secretion system protein TssA n=1 Tax=Candidatus Electrothrix sp. TaxID=2170559 RepID=UPI00405635D3
MNIQDLRELGTTPIPGDNPAGDDVSYEPNFEALADEIEKLSSPTSEGAVNWQRITELGVTILRNESKNLLVACYLNIALLHTDGMQGGAVGIHILRNLLETWWDSMYPPKKRKKGRINILNWWDEKLRQLLSERKTETWSSEQRTQLLDDLEGIDTIIANKLEDGPMLRSLQATVSRLVTEKPKETAPTDSLKDAEQKQQDGVRAEPVSPGPPNQEHPQQPKPSPTPAPVSISEEDDANAYLRQGMELLKRAANHVFESDMSAILPYQLNRLIAWSEIDELPSNTDRVTLVSPPNKQIISMLEKMFKAKNWEDLLSAAESRVREHLFWLDLSYYSAKALNELGHSLAAQAVENETRLHILRLPGIESLSFNDKFPFATQQTKNWLVAESAVQKKNLSLEATGSGDNKQGVTQDLEEAGRLCTASGLETGLSWLSGQKKNAVSLRQQFLYDVGFCRLLIQEDCMDMARSFAQNLLGQIDHHGLEKWEPKLAAQGLNASYECFRRIDGEETAYQKKCIGDRLALLAPEQMLSLI